MRSPAEYYLKYLASDLKMEMKDIFEEASYLGILTDSSSIGYLEFLRKRLSFPKNYSPLDPTHKPTVNFLKKEKIWGLWHPNMAIKEAGDLYQMPAYRETVCASILAGFSPSAIKDMVLRLHKVDIMEGSLQEFYHYFWNIDLLTRDEIRTLVGKFDSTKFSPSLVAAAASAKNHIWGAHLTLYKLGLMPTNLDKVEALRTAYALAYDNMVDTQVLHQGRSRSEAFKNYAGTMLAYFSKLDELEERTEDIISEFAAHVRITKAKKDPPTMTDVMAGKDTPLLEDIIEAEKLLMKRQG